jgi:hypothetical protein
MEFGASIFFTDYSISPAELAVAMEERGFDSVWAAEHSPIPVPRRYQRAKDVAEAKQQTQKRRVIIRADPHWHDDRIDAFPLEPWIVDHRGLEALGRIAEMREQCGAPADMACCRQGQKQVLLMTVARR